MLNELNSGTNDREAQIWEERVHPLHTRPGVRQQVSAALFLFTVSTPRTPGDL